MYTIHKHVLYMVAGTHLNIIDNREKTRLIINQFVNLVLNFTLILTGYTVPCPWYLTFSIFQKDYPDFIYGPDLPAIFTDSVTYRRWLDESFR